MKNWFASKTKVSLRRKHRRIGTKGGERRNENVASALEMKSSVRASTVVVVSESTLTYAVLREVIDAHGVRSVIDLRQNPRLFRANEPRLTVDPHAGIVAFLTTRGSRYFWLEPMVKILADGSDRRNWEESMEQEGFEHVQDFLRLIVSRRSNALLIIPEGTNELFDRWLTPRLELIWHFDPMSVLSMAE